MNEAAACELTFIKKNPAHNFSPNPTVQYVIYVGLTKQDVILQDRIYWWKNV